MGGDRNWDEEKRRIEDKAPNILNLLRTNGHRFGHPSGLDESSGRNSTTFRHRIAFRVYLVFSKISKNPTY